MKIGLEALAGALFSVRTNSAGKTVYVFWQITDRDKTIKHREMKETLLEAPCLRPSY